MTGTVSKTSVSVSRSKETGRETDTQTLPTAAQDSGETVGDSQTLTIPTEGISPQWVRKFAKHELEWLAAHLHKQAQQAHQEAREWQNRCLLSEAQLATLRAEYEPHGMEPCS